MQGLVYDKRDSTGPPKVVAPSPFFLPTPTGITFKGFHFLLLHFMTESTSPSTHPAFPVLTLAT
jgi:hypothetical protein